jgi:FkbM family methyltransferase
VSAPIDTLLADAETWMMRNRSADVLRDRLQQNGCHIYGAGGYGRQVAGALTARGIAVDAFIDGAARPGAMIEGIPVVARDDVDVTRAASQTMVVAINNFQTSIHEVAEWGDATFSDVLYVPELPDVVDPALGNYWQGARALVRQNAASIARLHGLLADSASRAILEGLIDYRLRAAPQFHPVVDRDHQYFARDILLQKQDLAVVDCGAWPGDMIGSATAAGHRITHWYAFEPDPRNFADLAIVARDAGLAGASLFPCGVGDRTGMVSFAAGSADASRAVDDATVGATSVPIVRIDDVIDAARIDMVKLDIEGFEAQALDGMALTLARHRPRLCMAIYHKPADLWELPLRIADTFPGARLAIRQHGHNGYDTVLYADL